MMGLRMLVQYAYCRRLGYMEHAQKESASNAEVIEGRYLHRRVDEASSTKTLESDQFHARSVELSDPELGLSARLDLVEAEGGVATPIEYKRGKAPNTAEGTYLDHRIHVCAQGLLLRANGFKSEHGIVYYVGSKKRVVVEFDEKMVSQTRAMLREMEETVEQGRMPPPLVDSPKCPRCAMVEICMPDEVNFLSGSADAESVRLMYPKRIDAVALYVHEQGARVTKSGDCLDVRVEGKSARKVRLIDVSELVVQGNVQVTTQVLRELCNRGVPVCYTTYSGWFVGITTGGWHKNAQLRIDQHKIAADPDARMAIARKIVNGKIRNCATILRRNGKNLANGTLERLSEMANRALTERKYEALLGIEGLAARTYFGGFGSMIRSEGVEFDFTGRNRRPPQDPVNAVLSYLYSILTARATAVADRVGLDPYVGFLHMAKYGKPALALDLIEEFRPIVADSACITAINNGNLRPSHFVRTRFGVHLTKEGKRNAVLTYEKRMDSSVRHPSLGYSASYRRIMETQARLLARHLLGEIPEYPAFKTR